MDEPSDQPPLHFKSGFVAIVGPPNVGKSTLLNQFLGTKVAIATSKPQTTRRQVRGILTGEDHQIIFIDTPGFHEGGRLLNRSLMRWALDAVEDVDVILLLVDVTRRSNIQLYNILDLLKKAGKPVILLLNKIDLVAKETLLPLIEDLRDAFPFEAVVPVSAYHGDGLGLLLDEILRLLPEGPLYYEGTAISDQTREELVAELVREKIFLFADQEIPYVTAVEVDKIGPAGDAQSVRATIFVEKPSQKGIIIGRDGQFIKRVRVQTERELAKLWGIEVRLDLWVKVLKDWTKDERHLRRLGIMP